MILSMAQVRRDKNPSKVEAMKIIIDFVSLNGHTTAEKMLAVAKTWRFSAQAFQSARIILWKLGYLRRLNKGYIMPQPEAGREDFLKHYPDDARAWVSQYETGKALSHQFTYPNKESKHD